jgi:nucleotide-binding universal stress UspA family protein
LKRTPRRQGLDQIADEVTNEQANSEMLQSREVPTVRLRVLCVTDLSSQSQYAVGRAALLANRLDAQLVLLHVMEPDQMAASSLQAREQIAQQLTSIALSSVHEPVIELRAGDYIHSIAAVAKETRADLIILGSPKNVLAPLIGTATERITELAGRPVLISNLDPRERYGAVLMAVELCDAFIRVAQLASRCGFLAAESVSVVHGFESPYRGPLYADGFDVRAAKRNIEEWERAAGTKVLRKLDDAGVESSRFRVVFQQARPIRAVQRVVRRLQPDLLIVGTKDRSMLSRVMRGSVANDVLRRMECDVLVASPDIEAASALF